MMWLLLWLLITGTGTPVVRAQGADHPIDLDQAREIFEEARTISELERSRLWGVPLHGPILLTERSSRFVVANRSAPTADLEAQGDVFVGTLPAEIGVANTATEWGGVEWTMLVWPLPSGRYARRKLLAHEMFHRIQDDLALPARDPENEHLDTYDGRTWLRLEWHALREALIHSATRRREAIADALRFRAQRHKRFPDKVASEFGLELNEGLAEYTGLKASTLPEAVLADRAAVALDEYDQRESFVRNFAYASGPAYGVLLDESDAQWRSELTPESDLGALLARAYDIALDEIRTEGVRERATRYDGAQIFAQEAKREAERQAQLERFRTRFETNPVLVIQPADKFRYTFNPNAIEAYADVGLVYATTRVTDVWGILEVNAGGALMVREHGMIVRVVVPAPEDPTARPVTGDGWTLSLEQGWSVVPHSDGVNWRLERDE